MDHSRATARTGIGTNSNRKAMSIYYTIGVARSSVPKPRSCSTRTGSRARALLAQRVQWSAVRATKEGQIQPAGVYSVRLAIIQPVHLLAMRSAFPRSVPLCTWITRPRLLMGEQGKVIIRSVTKAMLRKGAHLPASQMETSQANRNASQSHVPRSALCTGCLRIAPVALVTSVKCNVHVAVHVQMTVPSIVARTARSRAGRCVTAVWDKECHAQRRSTMHNQYRLAPTQSTMASGRCHMVAQTGIKGLHARCIVPAASSHQLVCLVLPLLAVPGSGHYQILIASTGGSAASCTDAHVASIATTTKVLPRTQLATLY